MNAVPKRVILIDNQKIYRECLRDLLNRSAFYKVVAESEKGESGINIIKTVEADIILLDLIPSINGYDSLRDVRDITQKIIIILSMEDEPEVINKALEMGANGFCAKNVSLKDLIDALNRSLAGENPVRIVRPRAGAGICEL